MLKHGITLGFFLFGMLICCPDKSLSQTADAVDAKTPSHHKIWMLNTEKVINDPKSFCNEEKSNLSYISNSLTYIVLDNESEKGERVSVKYALQTIVGEKYIILNCVDRVLLFDKFGKFIRQVGKVGAGAGDYETVSYIDVSETDNRIYINSSENKLLSYDFQGNFIEKIPVNGTRYFAALGNDLFALAFDNCNGIAPYRLIIQDKKGEKIAAFENNVKFPFKSDVYYTLDPYSQRFYRYNGKVYYRENYNDTIFKIENNQLMPHCSLYLGKFNPPVEARPEYLNSDSERSRISSKYSGMNIVETDKYFFLNIKGLARDPEGTMGISYIYYEKETDTCNFIMYSSFKRFCTLNKIGLENDIDGGLVFLSEGATLDGKCIFTTYSASEFKQGIQKAGYYEKIKYPEKKQALKELVDSIDRNTNMIIVVATLK